MHKLTPAFLSGVTACILLFGLISAGNAQETIDGRWSKEKAERWYDSHEWLAGVNRDFWITRNI